MAVQKLPSIVGVHSQNGEGKVSLDFLERLANVVLTSIPARPNFSPTAEDIRRRQAPDETPAHVSAAVCHGVLFYEATRGATPANLILDR